MLFPKKKVFLVVLILFISFQTRAKSYYFKHYQVDDGLSHNTVISLIQARNGFMWIGTKGGLNRFDGYTFKSFKNNESRFGTIGDNFILSICEDNNGFIWVGTGRGVFKYDPYKDKFEELKINPSGSAANIKSGVTNIKVDNNNNLWMIADRSLYRYNQKSRRITYFKITASSFAFDSSMNIWLGGNDGILKKYDVKKNQISFIKIFDKSIPANFKIISKIFCANDEVLIGTTKQGLKSYLINTGEIKTYFSKNADGTEIYVREIIDAGNNNYWIATESGIIKYDLQTSEIINLKKRVGDDYSLSDNAVYALYKDNQGGVWAGTFFGGLNYLSQETSKFEKYYPLSFENSISGNAVREICSDTSNNLWIGTEDAGLNKLNITTGIFTKYTSDGNPFSISYPNIHGLLAIKNRLYIGPFVHGLEIMDINTGKITERYNIIKSASSPFSSDFVMSIFRTSYNTTLIGTTGASLFRFDEKNKLFIPVKEIPKDCFVYTITEDHEGSVWIGSLKRGAFYYNPRTGKKGNFRFNGKADSSLNKDYMIQGIFEDSNQCMWFATEGGGLIKLNQDKKSFKKFTTDNGFPTNNVFRILEDESKNLWISTLKGLVSLDLKTEKFKVYTKSNGLITDQFNYNSAYKDHTGKMYFGSVKGMIAFNPLDFRAHQKAPSTYITDLQINNKDVSPNNAGSALKKSIIYTDSITLNYDQSNLNIEFAALSYASPQVTRYRYKMIGLDKDWTYLKSNRKAYFTDLSPGAYTFLVMAESNVGVWSGLEKKLHIKILPPFWKNFTAYIIYFLFLSICIYFSVKYYHKYLENRNLRKLKLYELEKEKEIYQAKIEFFTNIAHEIQTPLTLIKGPIERAIKKIEEVPAIRKNLQMIEKNTNRLLQLTSQLLDFRKTETNQFGLNFVKSDITEILQENISIFRAEADKKHVHLSINIPKVHLIAFVDPEAFIKISSNLLSNAIKYAEREAGITLIRPKAGVEKFSVIFTNDGPKIPQHLRKKIFEPFFRINKDIPGTGIGLSLAQSLTELHKGNLNLKNDDECLNIFELTLPVHQEIEFNFSKWKSLK